MSIVTLHFNQYLEVTVEKIVNTCDIHQLNELIILADIRIRQLELEADYEDVGDLDKANQKHQIILNQNKNERIKNNQTDNP